MSRPLFRVVNTDGRRGSSDSDVSLQGCHNAFPDFDGVHYAPSPVYLRHFLCWAVIAAADPSNDEVSSMFMKHDRESNCYSFVGKAKFLRRGDLQVLCATPAVIEAKRVLWNGQITKSDFKRDGKDVVSLSNPNAPWPDFSVAREAGYEVLAWRVYGYPDKQFMDTDGFVISGMDKFLAEAMGQL
ncbi:hypothetical protein F53441_4139 [Fusarium austroafricanum]|uniref:Uncharacterized protein n=1 Tax=Fusarium austroafricanum TaxID=2364996 RepID=A0A8H4KL11_9HYPO|nr:hypothetical protein F53441_4139 [Fusarium austroafricanum]